MPPKTSHAKQDLRAAWDDMIESLQEARDAIDQPALMPAPSNDRNLAEGYRYLMGFVHSAVERAFHEDPDRPHFRNALSIITRSTIDNADAIYFYAPIDGRENYLIRGTVGDARHWKGEAPAATGRIGSLNGHQMAVDSDGIIRIVLAHRDPGIPNWVDTSGHREGFMTTRWAYSETPAAEDWPGVSAKKVSFGKIRHHLPEDTAVVTPDERRAQIGVRQRHVQKRYRVF